VPRTTGAARTLPAHFAARAPYAAAVRGDGPGGRFADLLRAMRERAGLTQEELAERAGLTAHAISALERGTRTRPYPHTVRSLATALAASEEERAALVTAVPRRAQARPTSARTTEAPAAGPGIVLPPTRLFGREEDVAAVTAMAGSGDRLITLTGPGGVGKTRLAVAVSEAVAPQYPDGVVQVSLAPLADADAVVLAVGRALGLAVGDGPDALGLVTEHLGPLRLLLVLDNFEHLLSAAADVGRLVALCPELTVLVSSRSPLRLRGEREYGVPPLSLPRTDVRSEDELAASPAGSLVLDRARAVSVRLALDPDDVAALAELCHRLAGLPLAIELACAHLRLLAPRTLLDRVNEVMATSTARDLPERQRTMRTTLDWSYGLLTAEQQRLFRLLGVFRGGATLEAVEAVAGQDVLAPLSDLVDHSLVVVRVGGDGATRYDLLEPVAQYARSLLVGPEAGDAAVRHARFYVDLAERAALGYEREDQVLWLARTEAEEANLLVAIDRGMDTGGASGAARITWALWLYWWLRGQSHVGRRRGEQCVAADLPADLQSRVRLTAATMSYAGGDLEAAAAHWAQALRLGHETGDPEITCKATAGLGLAALGAGELLVARRRFEESLEIGLEAGEAGVWMRSLDHVWLGTVLMLQGDHAAAVDEIERGLELARGRGDRLSTYVALYNLSQVALARGEHLRARPHLEEGIRLSEQTQDQANLAYFLEAVAVVEAAEGDHRRVAGLLGAARGLRETAGANVYAYYVPDEALRSSAEEQARARLGEDTYDDLVDASAGLDLPAIVRLALGGTAGAVG
jgi:predicted ATPase/transcriptional regulator with XRE-family HTH domain